LKLQIRTFFTILVFVSFVATQACNYFRKSEFTSLIPADLTALAETLPARDKRGLAQNEQQRKQIIDSFKQAFSLAQAAEAEGLNNSDKFKVRSSLNSDRLLANEFSKRNPEVNISKEEADAYYASHKDAFEADYKVIYEGKEPSPSEEQKQQLSKDWTELKVRAQKARQAGLEKDPLVVAQLKFSKARLLANLYSESLQNRHKLTQEEKNDYFAKNPEADPEKLKQKAQELLDRVKKGESFEKISDEINKDRTKGIAENLGWFGKGRMDPAFEKAAFAMQKGEVSNELVKSSFGYHIIKVDDRRLTPRPPAPATPGAPDGKVAGQNVQQNSEPQEEIQARHILISTREADSFEQKLIDEKVKRAAEDVTIKYPVKVPVDFLVKVEGVDPSRTPGLGSGDGGRMKGPDPNEKK
jgi:parvulin-like peptidyl-prolyl isomerase